jgi:succinate dehydrogenase / fumarate reductase flavoprotein subunit
LLKVDHLGEDVVNKRLPGIRDMCRTFLHIEPSESPIPVFPTAHYVMGGIPTNRFGQVVMPQRTGPEEAVPGLYAAGECACVSVHGANRLGGNSLLDILVFGRAAADDILQYLKENTRHKPIPQTTIDKAMQRLLRWDNKGKGETVSQLRDDLKKVMEDHCGVFREASVMQEGVEQLKQIRKRMKNVYLTDHSKAFNTARIEAMELENLVDISMATMLSASQREESRGAHSRVDFPERNDKQWMKHSLYFIQDDHVDWKPVRTKPLSVESFPPKKRVY